MPLNLFSRRYSGPVLCVFLKAARFMLDSRSNDKAVKAE